MRQIIALVAAGIVGGAHVAAATTLEASSRRDTSLIKSFVAAPQLIQSSDFSLRGATEGAADVRSKPLRPQAAGATQARGSALRSYAMQAPAVPARGRPEGSSQVQNPAFAGAARFQSVASGDPAAARGPGHPIADFASRDTAGIVKSITARDPAKASPVGAPARNLALATKAQVASAVDRLKLAPARRIAPTK